MRSGAVLPLIGVLVVGYTIFSIGRGLGYWAHFNDYWLFYRSPLCRLPDFLLGVLLAA